MSTMTPPAEQHAALDALSDLVDTARDRRASEPQHATECHAIARTLDRARTRLVEDGPGYLDAAWAFVDAGRKALAQLR